MPVSSTDELTVDGGNEFYRTRRLDEYKPTNAPLSEAEIEHRKVLNARTRTPAEQWAPRDPDIVEDMKPLPEAPAHK